MFKRILVPLDGSELAQDALPLALRLARAGNNSELVLVRATEVEMMMIPAGGEYELAYHNQEQTRRWEQAQAYLHDLQLSDQCQGVLTSSLTHVGDPASVILDTAADKECDLIVMTTHGYRGLTRWMLGSVTERVLRHATCPVLVLREDRPIQHILVPLDGSALAETAIEPALEMAARLDAAVLLLRVDDSLSQLDYASLDALDQFEPGMAEVMRVGYAHRGEE
jgi:nucleotide-binding universal stress UspA family protein